MIGLSMASVMQWALISIIVAFALIVLIKIYTNQIDLESLLNESGTGKASMSRFQFLIFTFVIAGLYLTLSLESGTLVEVPNGALLLLGISAGGYLVGKGVKSDTTKS